MAVDWQAFATAFLTDSAKYISENKDKAAAYKDKIKEQAEQNKKIYSKRKLAAASILQQVRLAEGLNATPGMIRSALSAGPDGIIQLTQNLERMKKEIEAGGGNWTAEAAQLRIELPEFFVSGAGAKAPAEGYKSLVDERYGVNVGEIGSTKAPDVSPFRKALGYNAKEFIRASLDEDSAFGTGMSTYDLSQIDATSPYSVGDGQRGYVTYKAINEFDFKAIEAESTKIANASRLITEDVRYKAAAQRIKTIQGRTNIERDTDVYATFSPNQTLAFDDKLIQKELDIMAEIRSTFLTGIVSAGIKRYGADKYFGSESLVNSINSVAGDPTFVSRIRGGTSEEENTVNTRISPQDFNRLAEMTADGSGSAMRPFLKFRTNHENNEFIIENTQKQVRTRYKFTTNNAGKITRIDFVDLDTGQFMKSFEGDEVDIVLTQPLFMDIPNERLKKEKEILKPKDDANPLNALVVQGTLNEAFDWGMNTLKDASALELKDGRNSRFFNKEDGTITPAGIQQAVQNYFRGNFEGEFDLSSPLKEPKYTGSRGKGNNKHLYMEFAKQVGDMYNEKILAAKGETTDQKNLWIEFDRLEAEKKALLEKEAAEKARLDAETKRLFDEKTKKAEQVSLEEEAAEKARLAEIERLKKEEAAKILKKEKADSEAATAFSSEEASLNFLNSKSRNNPYNFLSRINSNTKNLTIDNKQLLRAVKAYMKSDIPEYKDTNTTPTNAEVEVMAQRIIRLAKQGELD